MFIVFEGVDGSGKSTIATELSKRVKLTKPETGVSLLYTYTKEPTFSSETADSLNLKSKNDIQREVEFMIDRICHNEKVLHKVDHIICDRYIWTGLAYCKIYNPKAFEFAQVVYNNQFFRIPDHYIFVDTPIEICYKRKKVQPLDHLQKIRQTYLDTKSLLNPKSKFSTISGVGNIEYIIQYLIRILNLEEC